MKKTHQAKLGLVVSFFFGSLTTDRVVAQTQTAKQLTSNYSQEAQALLPIITAERENFLVSQNSDANPTASPDSNFIIPPQVVPDERVAPLSTLLFLNEERAVNHLTRWNFDARYLFSDDRSENLEISFIGNLESEVIQSLSRDNIFRSDFQGHYFELKTVNQERTVTVTTKEPQTLNGSLIQQTFTGSCEIINPQEISSNQQCNLLPTLVTDRDRIDPDFLFPTRIEQTNNLGEIVPRETLELIKQPGFQNRGVDGEPIGVDLLFPNSGGVPGNSQSQETTVSREEGFDLTFSGRYYQTRQVVKANEEEAVLGRTVRGLGIVADEENIFLNTGVQAAAQLIPDLIPKLEGSREEANTNINRNLFLAANNTRLPENGLVIYQGGLGRSKSLTDEMENGSAPDASFNSVWLGLSPVVERSLTTEVRFETLGNQQRSLQAGGEGGAETDIDFFANIDGLGITTDLLEDFYIQNYVSFLERDVNFVTEEIFTEETNYYPHLSLTGNITGSDRAFRYYGGVIASEEAKVYLGSDYTENINNWRVNIAAIGYTNPDRDYFSRVEGVIGRQWEFDPRASLTVSAGFRYAWDRPEEDILDDPIDNNANIGATLRVDRFSLNLRRLFDIFPDSTGNQVRAGIGVDIGDRATLSAFFIPQRDIESFGLTGEYQLGNEGLLKSVIVQWNRSVYDFGEDVFSNNLTDANDTFSVLVNFSPSP